VERGRRTGVGWEPGITVESKSVTCEKGGWDAESPRRGKVGKIGVKCAMLIFCNWKSAKRWELMYQSN